MPIMTQTSSYTKRAKLDGRTGLFILVEYDPEKGQKVDGEVSKTADFLLDPASIMHGWADFTQIPPQFSFVTEADDPPPKPTYGEYSYTVRVYLWVAEEMRELSTSAIGVIRGLDKLFGQIKTMANKKDTQVAHVKLTGSVVNKSARGPSHVPTFEVVGWVDRPTGFDPPPVADVNSDPADEQPPAQALEGRAKRGPGLSLRSDQTDLPF